MIRTFLALDLPEVLLGGAATAARSARAAGVHGRWVDPALMHVTLRFFGPTDEALVPRLAELVTAFGARAPAVVRFGALDAFPDQRRARVLVLPVEELAPGDRLTSLATEAEAFATALGFAAETRPYRPHLTLARFKQPADVRAVTVDVGTEAAELESVTLYASQTGHGGPSYTPLARARFGG